jgi:hypothetical protein
MGLNKGNYLEALVDILFQIGDVSPCLSEYDELFSQHPDVLYHVDSFKVTILKFNTGLMEVFNKPGKLYSARSGNSPFHDCVLTNRKYNPSLARCFRLLLDSILQTSRRDQADTTEEPEAASGGQGHCIGSRPPGACRPLQGTV